MIILRIIEKIFILYFGLYVFIDILLYLFSFLMFRFGLFSKSKQLVDIEEPSISIIVPAYNEEVSICVCVEMLRHLDYSNYNVIIVNDGSKDNTLQLLLSHFDFIPFENWHNRDVVINTAEVKNVYITQDKKLLLIDKQNEGKADAINSGLNFSDNEYICTIDADSILDARALKTVIQPMLKDRRVFVCGGQIALSNDLKLVNNQVVSAEMPKNILVLWQILEYINTFMIARLSLSRINALLIMSGAFSIFRKCDLLAVGGFLSARNTHEYIIRELGKGKQTITEDMEIVLRLWKYFHDKKVKAKALFLPGPVCWTEAPEKLNQLYKQRLRWHQGLGETLWMYRTMMFEPKYGMTGMVAMPYYFFMEFLAPVIKLLAFIMIAFLLMTGNLHQDWIIYFMLSAILLYTIIISSMTVIIEKWSLRETASNRETLRYKTIYDWLLLLLSGMISNFSYDFVKMFAQIIGIKSFLQKRHNWMKFERKGIKI